MFVIEPSDAVNVGMAIQTKERGHFFAQVSALRSLVSWLVAAFSIRCSLSEVRRQTAHQRRRNIVFLQVRAGRHLKE
jgi:hypothetical protein